MTTGFSKIASIMGCSSVIMGNKILDSSTSSGRFTSTTLICEVGKVCFPTYKTCFAKDVVGRCKSSPRGPRISCVYGELSSFLFFLTGSFLSNGPGDWRGSWPFAVLSCFCAHSLKPRAFFLTGADGCCSTNEDLVSSSFSDSAMGFSVSITSSSVESYSESELSNDVSDTAGLIIGCRPQPRRID